MAVEIIAKTLAPDNAPYINGVRAGNKLAEALLKNMYQGLVETNGRGITDQFTTETEVNENAQIFVNRVLPVQMLPREQGASKNGGSFSNDSHYTQTETVSIEMLTVIDDTIVIPGARQRMIKTDLLAAQTDIYGKRLNTIINGATASSKLFATWKAELDGEGYNAIAITDADVADRYIADKIVEANDLLDEGDMAHGIDIFPQDTRIAVFKAGTRHILKSSGVLVIGGSNYAQDILAAKGISHSANTTIGEDGYMGDIDGVPCHMISNESLGHADGFLGLPKGTLKASPFFGYVASSYANARGVSTVDQVKVVDAIAGQGVIFQPFTKLGVVSWYAKGNVILTREEAYKGVFAQLKALFAGIGSTITLKLKAAGSRLFPVFTTCTATTSNLTVVVNAFDGRGAQGGNHVKDAYYITSKTPITNVAEFLAGVKGATHKGKVSNLEGGSNSITASSQDYVAVLAIADDGSLALAQHKVG